MSKSYRDQRGRPHSNKRCPESKSGGCAYCVTGDQKPHDRKAKRAQAKAEIRKLSAQEEEPS